MLFFIMERNELWRWMGFQCESGERARSLQTENSEVFGGRGDGDIGGDQRDPGRLGFDTEEAAESGLHKHWRSHSCSVFPDAIVELVRPVERSAAYSLRFANPYPITSPDQEIYL